MIMEPRSRDEIERSVVTREPMPSILVIGRSTIVATQVERRPGSAYQDICNDRKAYRSRLLKRQNECQSTGWTVALISRPTQVSESLIREVAPR